MVRSIIYARFEGSNSKHTQKKKYKRQNKLYLVNDVATMTYVLKRDIFLGYITNTKSGLPRTRCAKVERKKLIQGHQC